MPCIVPTVFNYNLSQRGKSNASFSLRKGPNISTLGDSILRRSRLFGVYTEKISLQISEPNSRIKFDFK